MQRYKKMHEKTKKKTSPAIIFLKCSCLLQTNSALLSKVSGIFKKNKSHLFIN